MAIQHKDCPRCGATVGNYITRCECGFSFEGIEDTEPTQRLETMAEEERLYEDYLTARAKQAIAEAADARASALSEPDNYYWLTRVEQSEAARDALMAELYQQKLRNSELLTAIDEAKSYSKKKVHALNPLKHRSQERPHPVPPPMSRPSVVKPAAARTNDKSVVLTPIAGATAKNSASNLPSQTDRMIATAVTDIVPAPTVAPTQTLALEPILDLSSSASKPSTVADEISAYTAKLEEILSASKPTVSSVPTASAAPVITLAPKAPPQTSQLTAAVQRAASLIVALNNESFAVDTGSNTPPPVLRPEERLEYDSKAIRARAVAMAERLFGASDSSMQTVPETTYAERAEKSAAAFTNAIPADNQAIQSKPAEQLPTPSAPPAVESEIIAVTANAPEVKQKKKSARTEPPNQMHTKYPPRNTRLPRAKPDHARPTENTQDPPVPEPYIEDRPSAIFRAIQAAKADKIVQEARAANTLETKHCPFCSATHAGNTERCGCGYVFENMIELPELVLSNKERTELLDDGIHIRRPKPPR